jgi:hypothetical protein
MNLSSVSSMLRLTVLVRVLAGVLLLGTLSAPDARADSIGINFVGGRGDGSQTGDIKGPSLAPGTQAGLVLQSNWNNVESYAGNAGLNDSNGGFTNTRVFYSAQLNALNDGTPSGGQEQLNIGGITSLGTTRSEFILSNIAYSQYDIYVYNLGASAGAVQQTTLGTGANTSTFYSASPDPVGPGYVDGNPATNFRYTIANSRDLANPTPNANVVRFVGLTGSDQQFFTLSASSGFSTNTVRAIQIVNTSPVPEPSTYAMMALGLVALCVLGAKRKKSEAAL